MVVGTEPIWDDLPDGFERSFDDAVVYGDADKEEVLHEGPTTLLVNGWVELPSGRVLSPSAVHHVDPVTEQ